MTSRAEYYQDAQVPDMERRLASVARYGTVAEINYSDKDGPRVRVKAGNVTTGWLPWSAARAGRARVWSPLKVGEQVLLLAPGGDMAQAAVVGSFFSKARPAPSAREDETVVEWDDGAVDRYDEKTHTRTLEVPKAGKVVVHVGATKWTLKDGEAELECKTVTLNASEKIVCNTPTLEVPNGDVVASGVSLKSHLHTDVQAGSDFSGPPLAWNPGGNGGGGGGGGGEDTPEKAANREQYANGGTRAKYNTTPVWQGLPYYGGAKIWDTRYPADTARVPAELYYERFRIAQDKQIEGEPRRIFSTYDAAEDKFTEAAIQPWNGADYYHGPVPHGMLASDVVEPAYKVYTAEDGTRMVMYSPVTVTIKTAPPWYEAYVSGKETFMVLYKISEEEFEQWKNPPPEVP